MAEQTTNRSDSTNRSDKVLVRSKIIATVGPACRHRLRELALAGVDVFRLNTAHGSMSEHGDTIRAIRELESEVDRPLSVLVDLAGPKIRIGTLNKDPLFLHRGDRLRLVRDVPTSVETDVPVSMPQILSDLRPEQRVLFADGTIRVRVVGQAEGCVDLEVESGGELRSKQGINVPGATLHVPTITDEDRAYAQWAVRSGADFISQSFVRAASDMRELAALVKQAWEAAGTPGFAPPALIAKIEKREALDDLEEIVRTSDAIMVARGDLGVEIDVAETPIAQKRILAVCRRFGRPAIVATQMLDSMQSSPRPTRAEATDVANAVLDGADACMLSGETAVGDYPIESVTMMNRILQRTEAVMPARDGSQRDPSASGDMHRVTSSIVAGCAVVASESNAAVVAVMTNSGATALALSSRRLPLPILGASYHAETARRMCLYWGVEPVWLHDDGRASSADQRLLEKACSLHSVAPGDRIVFVTGRDVAGRAHNEIVVQSVE